MGNPEPAGRALPRRVDAWLAGLAVALAGVLGVLDLDAPWEHGLRGSVGAGYAHRFVEHHLELGLARTRAASVVYVDPRAGGELRLYTNHPMGHPLLLLPLAWLLGPSEASLRLGALLLWLPAPLLLWRIGRRLLAPPAAGAAALLLACLPMASYFGPMVGPDGAVLSALLLATLLALRALESPTRARRLALAAACAGGVLLDWPMVFAVPLILLLARSQGAGRGAWRLAAWAAGGAAVGLVLVVAHMVFALGSAAKVLELWSRLFGWTQRVEVPGWLGIQAGYALDWLGPLPLALAALGAVLALRDGAAGRRWLLAAAALALPGLLHVLIFRRHALVHPYWALGGTPGLALLAARPLQALGARGWTRRRAALAAAVGVALVAACAVRVQHEVRVMRTDEYREVGELLQARFGRGDLVVSSVDLSQSDVYADATLFGPVELPSHADVLVRMYAPPDFTGRLGFALPLTDAGTPLARWLRRFGKPEKAGRLLVWRVR